MPRPCAREWNGGVGHDRRVLDQALDAAQAFGQREDLAPLRESGARRPGRCAGRARSCRRSRRICAPRQRVLRMRRQARVVHARDLRLRFQPLRQRQRVLAVALHAQRQRLHAAQRQEAVERAGDRADRVLQKAQLLAQRCVPRCSLPTTATPPITSEWPFRYLVVECTTMSKPSSSGRCTHGLAKVLSATRDDAALAADARRSRAGRPGSAADCSASRPRPCAFRAAAPPRQPSRSVRSTKLKRMARAALAHLLEQAEGAAVQVVAGRRCATRRRAAPARSRSPPGRRRTRRPARRLRGRPRSAPAPSASGCASGRSRGPCARRGSAARRSRSRRSAA